MMVSPSVRLRVVSLSWGRVLEARPRGEVDEVDELRDAVADIETMVL